MNDLIKWASGSTGSPMSRRDLREQGVKRQAVIAKTRDAALELDGLTALYGYGMQRAVDIDNLRHQLASNSEELHAILTRYELGFIAAVETSLRRHNNPFGL